MKKNKHPPPNFLIGHQYFPLKTITNKIYELKQIWFNQSSYLSEGKKKSKQYIPKNSRNRKLQYGSFNPNSKFQMYA